MSSKQDPMMAAKTKLVLDHPFFAVLALRTKFKEDESVPTAYTDGDSIGWNPKWFASLPEDQQVGVLIHELYHKVFMHHLRIDNRDPEKWNIACDYAINPLLEGIPRVSLPSYALKDPRFAGMSAEQIYNILPDQPKKGGKGEGEDPGGCGGIRVSRNGKSREENETDIKDQITTAVMAAKERGKLPAGMDIYLDELLEPQVPWVQVLRRFMTERTPDDYTWARPNRRFVGQGMYLPSRLSEDAAGEFAIGVDTSGSMLGVLNDIMCEVNGIMEDVRPLRTHVIYCDAAVGRHDVFERDEELEVTPNGGGGTDFCPVFDKIEEEGIRPKCLIFITDGYGTFPSHAPDYPVLWVMTENVEPPFGEVIYIEVNG